MKKIFSTFLLTASCIASAITPITETGRPVLTGVCPSAKMVNGKCTVTVSNGYLMLSPDKDTSLTSVTIGDYIFSNPKNASWVYGPPASIGGGIGALAFTGSSGGTQYLTTITRTDNVPFTMDYLTVFDANIALQDNKKTWFTGTHADGTTFTSPGDVLSQFPYYPVLVNDPVFTNVNSLTIKTEVPFTYYIRDFSFTSAPVPENPNFLLLLLGLCLGSLRIMSNREYAK